MAEYIEREVVLNYIHKKGEENFAVSPLLTFGYAQIETFVKSLQSADVQPVEHGKWIERNPQNSKICRLIECSECGEGYVVNINIPYNEWVSTRNRKYCGCCGAYMRGEE